MRMATNDSTYLQVKFKKKEGSLTLTASSISFQTTDGGTNSNITIEWKDVRKHQVSPPSYPKSLLKLVLKSTASASFSFQLANSQELERIRKDVSQRLKRTRSASSNGNVNGASTTSFAASASASAGGAGKKRSFSELQSSSSSSNNNNGGSNPTTVSGSSSSFGALDVTALAVARATLLAANPALRQQHSYLVQETQTVSEDAFWKTHESLVEEESAHISGYAKAGTSSHLLSHLPGSGRVTLGVEEMRQIFILYPAVHSAYEELVPLQLSDEQFWRKYLESEYFHRDRGRVGTASRNHYAGIGQQQQNEQQQQVQQQQQQQDNNQKKKPTGPSLEEQDARAAAVGTDDLFSRYDQKLKAKQQQQMGAGATATATGAAARHCFGRKLAIGQFDLASTFETERGSLLEGPKDNYPPNQANGSDNNNNNMGSRVIQKYNRHWAMVLHPDEAVAGADLSLVARKSVNDTLPHDSDALSGGGVDAEMRRLAAFANATDEDADHAAGRGEHDEDYEPLNLLNVDAYYSRQKNMTNATTESSSDNNNGNSNDDGEQAAKRHSVFGNTMTAKLDALVQSLLDNTTSTSSSAALLSMLPKSSFPPPTLGKELLSALTKKMAIDSQKAEAASLEMANKLPEDFRNRLQLYFRRSSELLRHFFALRRLEKEAETNTTTSIGGSGQQQQQQHGQKLARIVSGLETVYRDMEGMRNDLPQTETGEMMRKMCLPIMKQLDGAFKLHRERSGGGGGGGFVDV